MWNDTDVPLAYLITFRCYGTWLHGDERGSIDRFHNRYKSPYIDPNATWHRHNAQVLHGQPVTLDASQRLHAEAVDGRSMTREQRAQGVFVSSAHCADELVVTYVH